VADERRRPKGKENDDIWVRRLDQDISIQGGIFVGGGLGRKSKQKNKKHRLFNKKSQIKKGYEPGKGPN